MTERIMVTGSAGFIGRAICSYLEKEGREVVKIDNLSTPAVLPVAPDTVRVDVRGLTVDDLSGVTGVVHLAAQKSVPLSFQDPSAMLHNLEVDAHLLRIITASGFEGPTLVAGSCEVYGVKEGPIHEDTAHLPQSPYAVSKSASEALAHVYRSAHPGSRVTTMRFFNTYGAESGGGAVIAEFIDALLRNEPLVVEGDGSQRRDFSHVDRVARIVSSLLSMPELPHAVNVGSGDDTAIIDIARALVRLHGAGDIQHGPTRTNEIPTFVADCRRLAALGIDLGTNDVLADLQGVYQARTSGYLPLRDQGSLVATSPGGNGARR